MFLLSLQHRKDDGAFAVQDSNGDKVLQTLTHLQAIDVQVTSVNKKVNPLFGVVVRFGLSELIFVVRKVQVYAATVDVDGFAQNIAAHGAAFDVPTWTSRTIWRVPKRLARFTRLP